MSIVEELKRRSVFRIAIAYLALAWLIIEVSSTLFPGFGIPDWAFRFVVVLLALGFIPTLVFSWTYEITPEGLKREKDIVRDESVSYVTARRLDILTIVVVVAAVIFIAVDRIWISDRPDRSTDAIAEVADEVVNQPVMATDVVANSIAVLPFANRSADPNDVFFVDGIHDDLLTYISQIGSIKTISRTSVMQYRDSTRSIPEIAEELGVSTILEGGVQRAGDQVRINVQLIDARTDAHLWSEIYDRELTAANIFSIQSEIAGMIAEALSATLTSENQQRIDRVLTESLEALEAYYLGRQQTEKRTSDALAAAIVHFNSAIEHDPDFALAYVGLADTYRLQSNYAGLPPDEMDEKGYVAVNKALQLDPLLGEAYASLANLRFRQDDIEGAEEAFKRSIELNPNYAPAFQWYGEMLNRLPDRVSEALELSRQSVALDPLSPIINVDYAESLERAGMFEDALERYLRALEIDPDFAVAHWQIGDLYWNTFGRIDETVHHFTRSHEIDPLRANLVFMAAAYLDLGDVELAESLRDQYVAQGGTEFGIAVLDSLLSLYRGDDVLAAEHAEVAVRQVPREWREMRVLRDRAIMDGKADTAFQWYQDGFPELFDQEHLEITRRNLDPAIDLAFLYTRAGQPEKAERLLTECESFIRKLTRLGTVGYRVADVQIAMIRGGPRERALQLLRQAVDAGWREDWWFSLQHDLALEPLKEEAGFHVLLAEIRADMAEQLARLRERQITSEQNSN